MKKSIDLARVRLALKGKDLVGFDFCGIAPRAAPPAQQTGRQSEEPKTSAVKIGGRKTGLNKLGFIKRGGVKVGSTKQGRA
jgi:hypothetical protein